MVGCWGHAAMYAVHGPEYIQNEAVQEQENELVGK